MEWQQLHQLSEEYQLQLLEADKLHKKSKMWKNFSPMRNGK